MNFYARRTIRSVGIAAATACVLVLTACTSENTEFAYPESQANEKLPAKYSNEKSDDGSIFGSDDGLCLSHFASISEVSLFFMF